MGQICDRPIKLPRTDSVVPPSTTSLTTVLHGCITIIFRCFIWRYNAIELSVIVIISIIVPAAIPRQFVRGRAQITEGLMALLAAAFALDLRYDRSWRHMLLLCFDPALVLLV